jgi:hypothetical protein
MIEAIVGEELESTLGERLSIMGDYSLMQPVGKSSDQQAQLHKTVAWL